PPTAETASPRPPRQAQRDSWTTTPRRLQPPAPCRPPPGLRSPQRPTPDRHAPTRARSQHAPRALVARSAPPPPPPPISTIRSGPSASLPPLNLIRSTTLVPIG